MSDSMNAELGNGVVRFCQSLGSPGSFSQITVPPAQYVDLSQTHKGSIPSLFSSIKSTEKQKCSNSSTDNFFISPCVALFHRIPVQDYIARSPRQLRNNTRYSSDYVASTHAHSIPGQLLFSSTATTKEVEEQEFIHCLYLALFALIYSIAQQSNIM